MSERRGPVIVVGGGAFGVAAALALRRRAHRVSLFDSGTVPREEASSTDISKMVRMDYGSDAFYTELAETALEHWDAWNRTWPSPPYHPTGFLLLAGAPMRPGGFEHDSFRLLSERGHRLERLDPPGLRQRFPAWNAARYPDGYYNPRAGWAESAAVVARLSQEARVAGVEVHERRPMRRLLERGATVTGVETVDGEHHLADAVVVAAGAWTPGLLPELRENMWPSAQTVLYFRPADPAPFRAPHFVPWGADIANTGWYGFPATDDGIVKVANHGAGRRIDPDAPRIVAAAEQERCRRFLRESLPSLADAPLAHGRICLYCDTRDGDFWIDRHPERAGLVVAAGGSGHGFKFVPVIGEIVADAVEGRASRRSARFCWRRPQRRTAEAARHLESDSGRDD